MGFLKYITTKNLTFFDFVGIILTAELARHSLFVLSVLSLFVWPMASVALEDYVKSREVTDGSV